MISLWHLLWIVPLSVVFGFVVAAMLCANKTADVYVDENGDVYINSKLKRIEKEVDEPK